MRALYARDRYLPSTTPYMRAPARELLVPCFTPSVWCGLNKNPRPPAPKADSLPAELSGLSNFYNKRFACWVIVHAFFFYRFLSKSTLFKDLFQKCHQSIKQFGSGSYSTFYSGLIWIQTVCKGEQQPMLVDKMIFCYIQNSNIWHEFKSLKGILRHGCRVSIECRITELCRHIV